MSAVATDPWTFARMAGRDYITPEDIAEARGCGARGEALFRIVLAAIGAKRAEDPACCAFAATDERAT